MTRPKVEASPPIGIDLGTWKCCVGVVRDGKVEIIENERGSKTTPSYVAFTETERLVGEDARIQASVNATNTVFGVKRMIGRTIDDPSLKDLKDTLPFKVKKEDGKPHIQVSYKGNSTYLCPEQVSAMLLTKMKSIAESHLGCEVKDAVISVPASFNNCQRQATKDAGAIAGLNVLGLINEPTAAALAYRDNKGSMDETIMVVDMGGGTLDVSVIRLDGDQVRVVETRGDTALGGMDLNEKLVRYFVQEFLEKSQQDISANTKAMKRLRLGCEKLKHTLSLLPSARLQLDCLVMDTDLESSLARNMFDELCSKEINECLPNVLRCSPAECDHKYSRVVLVGGSTRIPLVQEKLREVLGKSLDKSVNPDEAVAHGAAIRAALLAQENSVPDVAVADVYPHAVYLQNRRERVCLFPPGSAIPDKIQWKLPDSGLFHEGFTLLEVISASSLDTGREVSLGSVQVADYDRQECSRQIYTLTQDGILEAEFLIGKKAKFCLKARLNEELLESMKVTEERLRTDEATERARLVAINKLEAYCFSNKAFVEKLSHDVQDTDTAKYKQEFIGCCDDTIDWIDCNLQATEEDCTEKMRNLVEKHGFLVPPPPDHRPAEDVVHKPCKSDAASAAKPNIDSGQTNIVGTTTGTGGQPRQVPVGRQHPLGDAPVKNNVERGYWSPEGTRGLQYPAEGKHLLRPRETLDPRSQPPPHPTSAKSHPTPCGIYTTAHKRPHEGGSEPRDQRSRPLQNNPHQVMGGQHTAARAEARRSRQAHGSGSNAISGNNSSLGGRYPGGAVRHDRVGAMFDGTRIHMSRQGSSSSFESFEYINGGQEGSSQDKPSRLKRLWNGARNLFSASKGATKSKSEVKVETKSATRWR